MQTWRVRSLDYGYTFPLDIFRYFEVLHPSEEERKEYRKLLLEKRTLGKGELEAISICKHRGACNQRMKSMEAMKFKGKGFMVEAEMIRLAEKHGLKTIEVPITEIYVENGSTLNPWRHGPGNLETYISWISEKRPLFFFGIAGAVITIIGLIFGANVLYIANMGRGVAVGSALVSVLFIVIGVFSVFTGLILNVIAKGKK